MVLFHRGRVEPGAFRWHQFKFVFNLHGDDVAQTGGLRSLFEETLEDSFCAELVEPAQHGMGVRVQRAPVHRWRRNRGADTISSVSERQNPLSDQIFA
jgi:hypothetical protein